MPQYERRKTPGFMPDADPISKNILLDVDLFYPIKKGVKTFPGLIAITPALPSASLGGFVGENGGGGPVIVAGTETDLFILEAGQWVAQGLKSGPLAPPDRWRFTQYGLDIIAVNGVNPPYVCHNGTKFVPLGGNPPISSIAAGTDFSLFLIEAGTDTWFSSLSDAIWDLDIATETVSASLSSTPGPITAAWAIRGGMALYKRSALYAAQFEGPPFFWKFTRISNVIGTPIHECVVPAGDVHYFWGEDNFYRFDGFNLVAIPSMLREFFEADLDKTYDYLMWGEWDEDRSLVIWHYPSVNAVPRGTLDRFLCLNTENGEWGKGHVAIPGTIVNDGVPMTYDEFGSLTQTYNSVSEATYDDPFFAGTPGSTTQGTLTIEAPMTGLFTISQGLTYDEFGRLYGQYNLIPDIAYNSVVPFGASGPLLIGAFLTDHKLYAFEGPPVMDSSFTTGDFGDRYHMFQVTRLRPGFALNPGYGWSQVEVFTQYLQGTTPELAETVPMSPDGFMNCTVTDRLLRFKITVFAGATNNPDGGITYAQFETLFGIYNEIPNIAYNAPLFGSPGTVNTAGNAELADYAIEFSEAGEV